MTAEANLKDAGELLDYLLEGGKLSPAQLTEVTRLSEGEQLDFKSGKIFKRREKANLAIRRYTSAFANGIGGVLIIGVANGRRDGGITETRPIAPCVGHDDHEVLAGDATRVVSNHAPYLSPAPRISVVQVPEGLVLIVAVMRQDRLVPVVLNGNLAYYFRIGDSTIKAPDYLVSDLVLGRRNAPVIEASVAVRLNFRSGQDWWVDVVPKITIENVGMSSGRDMRCGIVCYAEKQKEDTPLPKSILPFISVDSSGQNVGDCRMGMLSLHHIQLRPDQMLQEVDLKAFQSMNFVPVQSEISMAAATSGQILIESKCAVYCVCQGTFPQWFELSLVIDAGTPDTPNLSAFVDRPKLCTIKQVARPQVLVRGLD